MGSDAVVEGIQAMLEEDVGWTKEGHHVEEGELVLVDQCRGRERARKEVQGWGWSLGVETLESLQGQPPVDREHIHLCRGEQEGGQTTEKLGGRVAGLYPEACCRITSVVPGHPTRNDGVEGLGVAGHPCRDTGKVVPSSA